MCSSDLPGVARPSGSRGRSPHLTEPASSERFLPGKVAAGRRPRSVWKAIILERNSPVRFYALVKQIALIKISRRPILFVYQKYSDSGSYINSWAAAHRAMKTIIAYAPVVIGIRAPVVLLIGTPVGIPVL